MFDFIIILLGASLLHLGYNYAKVDKLKGLTYYAAFLAMLAFTFFPLKTSKVESSLVATVPLCHVYVESDVDVSKWKNIGYTSTYTNVREFMAKDEMPVIVYNADEFTDDQARELYKDGYIIKGL